MNDDDFLGFAPFDNDEGDVEKYEDIEEDELDIEPEDCEDCRKLDEDAGIEYALNYYVKDRLAYCSNCNRQL